ncbi:MAG: triose-phosphate isomerase [Planctomycetota bacterium]|nr:triose-phosphate isomerase [Planctomycetota bacterium]
MKKHIVGNWKMNGSAAFTEALVSEISAGLSAAHAVVGVTPPSLYFSTAKSKATNGLLVGVQNCHEAESGAFTGEHSVSMIKDMSADFVIIGHSERRHVFGETDEQISAKVKAALSKGLPVILCVGEKLEERDAGSHEALVGTQTKSALNGVSAEQMSKVWVAYEPVWAIGTGRTASPEQAGAMHEVIRALLVELYGSEIAHKTPILYGGSVKPNNAEALLNTKGIDGALVGGASLKSDSFLAIINAAPKAE